MMDSGAVSELPPFLSMQKIRAAAAGDGFSMQQDRPCPSAKGITFSR